MWFVLQPGEPDLPRYQGFEEQEPGYQPGGSDCDPSRLAGLVIPSRKAAEERERCAESREDYRLQANDLIQQTRSADAAQAVVALTYEQSRIAVVSLIVGFFTLSAAILAAYYARHAATQTKRGASAAKRAVAVARDTAGQQLRAYVSVTHVSLAPLATGKPIKHEVTVKNAGQTPAYKLIAWSKLVISEREHVADLAGPTDKEAVAQMHLGPNAEIIITPINKIDELSSMDYKALYSGQKTLIGYGEVHYIDHSGAERSGRFRSVCGGVYGVPSDGKMAMSAEGNDYD